MERQTITVDISPSRGMIPQLRVSQGDIGRPLGVYIMQDGAALDCSSYTADLYILKADGNYYVEHVTVDSTETNLITWETAEQETPVAGECAGQIRILQGEDDIGTARFVEYVEASPGCSGAGSESAIESLKEYVRQAAESAASAEEDATAAAGSASAAAADAQTASGAATTATGASETATAAAETASDAAEAAQEVLDSIPEDYSEMADDVTGLKTAIEHKADAIYPTASGTLATFPDGADGMPLKSLAVHLEPIQEGSGDPSPENVRPISGHSGTVNVTRSGINLWNEQWELGNIDPSTGADTSSTNRIRSVGYIAVRPSTEYYFKAPYTLGLRYYDVDKNIVGYVSVRDAVKTTPDNCYYLRFVLLDATTYNHDVSINYPSTDHDYHPGTVVTYPITIPTSAGTVYGGTLDPVKGELTVTHGIVDLGTLTWTMSSRDGITFFYAPISDKENSRYNTGLCSAYPVISQNISSVATAVGLLVDKSVGMSRNTTASRVYARDDSYESASALQTALSGVMLCYELATPQTYTLTTPTEIQTLLGSNAIWSDTGAVSVEYPADTKLYIDRGQTEDDMTANATIARGQYFQIGTAVYLATDTILTGEQIIPGTNATPTTTAEALNQLISRQGGMWELIKSETFTNASAGAHDITTDDNNQPFELTDVRIMIALPKQDTASAVASYGQIRAYYDNTHYDRVQVGAVSMNAQDALKCSQCEILQQDGMIVRNGGTFNTAGNRWGFTFSNEATQSTSSHWQLCDPKRVYNRIYIESVTGTCTVQVFGKRKL